MLQRLRSSCLCHTDTTNGFLNPSSFKFVLFSAFYHRWTPVPLLECKSGFEIVTKLADTGYFNIDRLHVYGLFLEGTFLTCCASALHVTSVWVWEDSLFDVRSKWSLMKARAQPKIFGLDHPIEPEFAVCVARLCVCQCVLSLPGLAEWCKLQSPCNANSVRFFFFVS